MHRGVDNEPPENRVGTKKNQGEEFNERVAARNNNVTRFIYKKKKRRDDGEKGGGRIGGGGERRGKNRRAEHSRCRASYFRFR